MRFISRLGCGGVVFRFAASLFFITILTNPSSAGSWSELQMAPGVMLQDLCVLPDGQHGWAVGSSGAGGLTLSAILRTADGGANWELVSFPGESSETLTGVCFVSESTGWIVGHGGLILATTDGGQTWTEQTSGTGRKLQKVHFINQYEGWVTGGWQDGSSYLVLKTTNGGLTWLNQSFGTTCYSCDDIIFADSQHGWIVGRDNALDPHIHRTTDGGDSWVRQTVPAGAGPVSAIDFVTPKIGWATTSSIYEAPAGAILYTTSGGATWTIQAYTNLDYNYCLDAQDSLRVAIASVQILTPMQQKVFITDDGGATWGSHDTPIVNYTYGIQYVGDDVWLASDYSQILRSKNNGLTWDWETHAPLWKSLAWSDPSHGWLVAGSSVGTDGYCYRSTDGGVSWSRDRDVPGGAQALFRDADTGWMLWEGSGASVWRTTDGGVSWSRHSIGTGSFIGGIFFATADLGWAFGSNGTIRATVNGGVSWSSQTSGTSNYVQDVVFVSPTEGWAVGGYGGGGGFIRHTTNGGANWIAQTPAASDHFQSASFVNSQQGWLAAVGGRVHRTTDGGANWSIAGQVAHTYADKIFMTDAQNGWLLARNPHGGGVGEDGRGFIYATANGGTSWSLEWSGTWPRSAVSDIALQPGDGAWACGGHGTILYNQASIDVARSLSPAVLLALEPPEPNPFTASARIGYTIPRGGSVRVSIYNVMGQRTRVLFDGVRAPGAHELVWDGRDAFGQRAASGVYFVEISAGGRTASKRVSLVR